MATSPSSHQLPSTSNSTAMAFPTFRKACKDFHDQFYDIPEKTDFSIPTFLAFRAVFRLLSLVYLPPLLSTSLPLAWLGYRFLRSIIDSRDVFKTSFTDIVKGRHTARVPDGVVVFVLGARLNHPFGKLAPGTIDLDIVFKNMWREVEKNREKWGYLGRTATLADTSDNEGTTTVWISYWKDVKSLHEFAAGVAHHTQDGWLAEKYPCVGIMHETYHAPKGSYETIYGNLDLGDLVSAAKIASGGEEGKQRLKVKLVPNEKDSTLYTRMGRKNEL
ncbi:uncharacterized protein LY89DRAFT_784721 [Mollisia scopiformis]|uniref:Uncharacterized protein n=1 Tax=Mollisia scopiformis TaxID=149040 RepID=A0A194X102_MOLSC|nr:uncharacterized protein LY89DRAFT_784721 [Mollisia scopiformis]KUJ13870.1 hypothetical protein LY89DRAFT_784721 [Mollisia scopiformis]